MAWAQICARAAPNLHEGRKARRSQRSTGHRSHRRRLFGKRYSVFVPRTIRARVRAPVRLLPGDQALRDECGQTALVQTPIGAQPHRESFCRFAQLLTKVTLWSQLVGHPPGVYTPASLSRGQAEVLAAPWPAQLPPRIKRQLQPGLPFPLREIDRLGRQGNLSFWAYLLPFHLRSVAMGRNPTALAALAPTAWRTSRSPPPRSPGPRQAQQLFVHRAS